MRADRGRSSSFSSFPLPGDGAVILPGPEQAVHENDGRILPVTVGLGGLVVIEC